MEIENKEKIKFNSIEEEINFLMINNGQEDKFMKKESCFIDLEETAEERDDDSKSTRSDISEFRKVLNPTRKRN